MSKKNVVVILCDQLRADFLSCYGFEGIRTPNIDRLAKEGVRFEQAITASPVCAPARASMMTGRYVSDHEVWTNDVPFREGMEYLPQRVREAGYRTGCFGKLHHFPARDTKGFQVAFQMEENRLGKEEDYFLWLKERKCEVEDVFPQKNGNFPYERELYYENWIADRAMEFMGEEEEPFFAWISFQGPHTPLDPLLDAQIETQKIPFDFHREYAPPCQVANYRKERLDRHFTEAQNREYREKYCCLIQELDYQVGRILDFLQRTGQYENTVIIFSADHGDMCGDYGMRQKGPFLYEGQLRIPLIIAHHPQLPCGEASDLLTGNLDIASTVLGYIGNQKPLGYSRDIARMYQGKERPRGVIYSEFCDSVKIVATHEYRFAYYPFSGEYELIRVGDEMHPLQNLPEYQKEVIDMLKHVIDFMVIAKGVAIEAQDLTPLVQMGLQDKFPDYQNEIPLAFPIQSMQQIHNLGDAGLDAAYNEFCKERKIYRSYGVYWGKEKQENNRDTEEEARG